MRKLDEASVTAMISGFLAGKKKSVKESTKSAAKKKNEAFWKSINESLMLERGIEDYDDWRQAFSDKMTEPGGFYDDEAEMSDEDSSASDEAGVEVHAKPPKEVKKKKAPTAKGGNPEVQKEIAKTMISRVLHQAVEIAKKQLEEGNPIQLPEDLGGFIRAFIGQNFSAPNSKEAFKKIVLSGGFSEKDVDKYTAIAIAKGDILKFARTKMDQYPHSWADKMERHADVQGLGPDSQSRREKIASLSSAIPRLTKQVKTAKTPEKKEELEKKIEEYKQRLTDLQGEEKSGTPDKTGIGRGVQQLGLKQRKNRKPYPDPLEGHPELQQAIQGRKQAATSPVSKLFGNFPVQDILRYANYYLQNPGEVERAGRERIAPPGDNMAAKLSRPDDEYDGTQEIGSKSDRTVLSKDQQSAARQDFAKQQTSFNASKDKSLENRWTKTETDERERWLQSFMKNPDKMLVLSTMQWRELPEPVRKRLESAMTQESGVSSGLSFNPSQLDDKESKKLRPAEKVNYADMFRQMTDMSQFNTAGKKPEPITQKIVSRLAKKFNAPEGDVIDIIDALSVKGTSPEQAAAQTGHAENVIMAYEIASLLDPKRLLAKTKGDTDLKPAMQDFMGSEIEKVGGNIPARDTFRGMERDAASDAAKRAEERRQAEKSSAITPDEIRAQKAKEAEVRADMIDKITSRAMGLGKEKEELGRELTDKAGGADKLSMLRKSQKDLSGALEKQKQMSAQIRQLKRALKRTDDPQEREEIGAKLKDLQQKRHGSSPGKDADVTLDKITGGVNKIERERSFKYIAAQLARLKKAVASGRWADDPDKLKKATDRIEELQARMRPVDAGKFTKSPLAYRHDVELGSLPKDPYLPPGVSPERKKSQGFQWPKMPRRSREEKPFDLPAGNVSAGERELRIDIPDSPKFRDRQKMSKKIAGDASFKYGVEAPAETQKKLLRDLMSHARRQLALSGEEVTQDSILNYIAQGFTPDEEGEILFDDKYLPVLNLISKMGLLPTSGERMHHKPVDPDQAQQNAARQDAEKVLGITSLLKGQPGGGLKKPSHFEAELDRPVQPHSRQRMMQQANDEGRRRGEEFARREREKVTEGLYKKSLMELLVDIGTDENKHVKPQQRKDGWDKAQPSKKLNMVPKWRKSKMTLSELFKGELTE